MRVKKLWNNILISLFCASIHKAALTDYFADHFVRKNVVRLFDDVSKLDADTILYGDTWCKKWIFQCF